MKSELQRQKDALIQEMKEVLKEAESLYKDTTENGAENIAAFSEKIKEKIGVAKDKLGTLETEWGDKAKQTAQQADELVRDKPYHALGFAAAVGVVLGLLMRGGSR